MLRMRSYLTRLQLNLGVRQRKARHSHGIVFYIGFKTGPRTDAEGWSHALGGLELGHDSDGFAADLSVWSPRDYESQWRTGVARLAAGEKSSALVTSYAGPNAGFHFMWPMWRVGDQIIFTERLVPGETIRGPDVAEDFYRAVGERRSVSEDGDPISEWMVPFSDVLAFLANA
jgi:hypothetical protein